MTNFIAVLFWLILIGAGCLGILFFIVWLLVVIKEFIGDMFYGYKRSK